MIRGIFKLIYINKYLILTLVPLSTLINSCGNSELFQAVKNFAESRKTASGAIESVSEDFYQSCIRRYEFLAIEPVSLAVRMKNPKLEQKTPYQDRIEELSKCKGEWETGSSFKDSNSLLLTYMESLEKLASDDVIVFPDTTKDKLETAINGLPFGANGSNLGATPEASQAVKAGLGIFQLLSKIFFDGYRRDTLEEVITSTDQDIQEYTRILKLVVNRGYIDGYLEPEFDNINLYFNLFVKDILTEEFSDVDPQKPSKKIAFTPFPFITIDEGWREKREVVSKKLELARLYISFLDEVARGHHELTTMFKHRDQKKNQANSASGKHFVKNNDNDKNIQIVLQKRLSRIILISKELNRHL
jgi:hypothetical protein